MKSLDQNKQDMYYSLYSARTPIYVYDDSGEVVTQDIDGETFPVVDSYMESYNTPVKFRANISMNSGETKLAEYGLNVSDYDAIIYADKGKLPFDEQTIIWHKSIPVYDEDTVKPESADYKVVAIKTSLNEERFILKKRVDT